jgi:indole-3-glycerol phosphate synthase
VHASASLSSILTATRYRVEQLRKHRWEVEATAASAPPGPSFHAALRGDTVSVIAEVKRRSPSAGDIAPDLDPGSLARQYVIGRARAISVLTESAHFGGSLDDLQRVRSSVAVPVLRKDFLIDPIQVYESRAHGASAVLLIVRALEGGLLGDLASLARDLGMGCLIEVRSHAELERALSLAPDVIGVNSRDLETLQIDHTRVGPLLQAIPSDITAVAESGIAHRTDVERVARWGADAVLVGTAVARAPNPSECVRGLAGVTRHSRPVPGSEQPA